MKDVITVMLQVLIGVLMGVMITLTLFGPMIKTLNSAKEETTIYNEYVTKYEDCLEEITKGVTLYGE